MATFTFQFGDDFITELAAAIVRLQLHGEAVSASTTRSSAPPDADPWSTPGPGPGNPSTATTAPQSAPQAPPAQTGVFQVSTPKGVQTWTLGLANAPACYCGQPSAYIQGSTNGRDWARYGCGKGKDRDTYRSKCDFSQWA